MLSEKLLKELELYIESQLRIETLELCQSISNNYSILDEVKPVEIKKYIKTNQKPSLQQILFSYIDRTGLTDPDIYKKAGIDRKLFSKIRSIENYRPRKNSLIALALALELNKKETDKLLGSAGYSLSDSETSDLVIQFFLEKKIYDIDKVNEALDYFSLKPLVGTV